MSECQICARQIKDNTGVIAHHGYRRQWGQQSRSCLGARHESYAKSRDMIPVALEQIKRFLALRQEELVKIKEETTPLRRIHMGKIITIEKGDARYANALYCAISDTEREIKSANREIQRLQDRYDKWVST